MVYVQSKIYSLFMPLPRDRANFIPSIPAHMIQIKSYHDSMSSYDIFLLSCFAKGFSNEGTK